METIRKIQNTQDKMEMYTWPRQFNNSISNEKIDRCWIIKTQNVGWT